jgi:hypothetical protein
MLRDFKIFYIYVNLYVDKLFRKWKSWLVYHRICHCGERWWTWDNGKNERWRRVELRLRGGETWLSGGESDQVWDDIFYSIGGCEPCDPERLAGNGGANSMLRFWLEKRGDEMKRCQKIWNGDREFILVLWEGNVTWCGDVDQRRGSNREEKGRRQC